MRALGPPPEKLVQLGTILLFLVVIISPGSDGLIHSPAYGGIPATVPHLPKSTGSGERPWWEEKGNAEEMQTVSEKHGDEGFDIDLSLPNIGLKDPDDIDWPYGDEFSFDANMSDLMPLDMGMDFTTRVDCINKTYPKGGKLSDRLVMTVSDQGVSVVGILEFYAKYDATRKTTALGMKIEMKVHSPIPFPIPIPNPVFSYKGEVVGNKLIESSEAAKMIGMASSNSEREIPGDGFFFAAGSVTPGLTAIMFSALDVEGGDTATVWLINPLIEGFDMDIGPAFIRANITKLSECSHQIIELWEDTRESVDGYVAPRDVETYAIYEDKGDNDDFTEATFVYVDSDGRLIRMEEPALEETIVVELQKIRQDRPWWGKERDENE